MNPAKPNTAKKAGLHRLSTQIARRRHVSIALAGAGANGSIMVSRLLQMDAALRAKGICGLEVDVYDPDEVTPANHGRQFFWPSEVGKNKADCLVDRANKSHGVSWMSYPKKYEGELYRSNPSRETFGLGGMMSSYDFLITCVDTGRARKEIWTSVTQGPLPAAHYWLDLGNEATTGQVILGEIPGLLHVAGHRLESVIERYPEFYDGSMPESDLPSCSLAEALDRQDLTVNTWVTTAAYSILYRLLKERQTAYVGAFVNLEKQTPVVYYPAPFVDQADEENPSPSELREVA